MNCQEIGGKQLETTLGKAHFTCRKCGTVTPDYGISLRFSRGAIPQLGIDDSVTEVRAFCPACNGWVFTFGYIPMAADSINGGECMDLLKHNLEFATVLTNLAHRRLELSKLMDLQRNPDYSAYLPEEVFLMKARDRLEVLEPSVGPDAEAIGQICLAVTGEPGRSKGEVMFAIKTELRALRKLAASGGPPMRPATDIKESVREDYI